MAKRARTWPIWLLAAILAGLTARFALRDEPSRHPELHAGNGTNDADPPAAPLDEAQPEPSPFPATPTSPLAAGCSPHAERRCRDGDVWWFDSCGEAQERAKECVLTPCQQGTCIEPDELGCDEPITGRCDGDVVRSCFGGRLRTIDCTRRGEHCVMGAEGAECRPERDSAPDAPTCLGDEAHCEGDVLVRCLGGRELRQDCSDDLGTCLAGSRGREATCAYGNLGSLGPPPAEGCDACGCGDAETEERCNGRDDDGDGLLDQNVDCGPIPLLAFVVGQPGKFGSYDQADIEREVARVNQSLRASAVDAPALQVALDEVVWLDRPDWLSLPEEVLNELVHAPLVHPEREDFAIPVLFTDEVVVGAVPKPGTSTLPNGSCGGSQRGRGPDVGLIAVSKARSPTTVAHEIGHFLGLCHTHERGQARGVRAATESDGSLLLCAPPCTGEGDGICDTPTDPGAEICPYNSQCQVFCPGPEAPEPSNLMSYYTQCRARFTPEQQTRMRHTLALRRAWHPCLGGACPCSPGTGSCPPEMGCRPHRPKSGEVIHACALQGANEPGQACQSSYECRADATCIEVGGRGRCVRLCGETDPPCQCVRPGGLPVAVCSDDLG